MMRHWPGTGEKGEYNAFARLSDSGVAVSVCAHTMLVIRCVENH